jgi:hypothetical protein
MARQAALLMLTVHGYEIPSTAVTNDFYRQALELDLRSKQEFTREILIAMGGISRMRLSQYKALLYLTDEALDLADRHDIDKKKLCYVVNLPTEMQVELLRQIIDLNLTSKQVKEICEEDNENPNESNRNDEDIPRRALQIARAAKNTGEMTGVNLAKALMRQEQDVDLAQICIRMMRKLLDEAERHLQSQ